MSLIVMRYNLLSCMKRFLVLGENLAIPNACVMPVWVHVCVYYLTSGVEGRVISKCKYRLPNQIPMLGGSFSKCGVGLLPAKVFSWSNKERLTRIDKQNRFLSFDYNLEQLYRSRAP